jgi:membrane protease YdiL (CAAX protease family)
VHPYVAVEPVPEPGSPAARPARGKSALAFVGVLLALFPAALLAQSAHPVGGLAATQLFVFLVPALVATAGSNLRLGPYLRLRAPRPSLVVLGVLAGAAASLVAAGIATSMHRLLPRGWVETHDLSRLFEGPPWEQAAVVAVAAALAPACEEITFRGYLQTTLALERRPAAAIAGGAFLFALLHLDPVRFPALFLLGAAFGWMTWRAGSVWPAIAAHATNNGLAAALFLAAAPPPDEELPLSAIVVLLTTGTIALAGFLLAISAAGPRPPPPAGDAVALRDPTAPSIRFDPRRVPRPLAAAAAGGVAILLALALLGLAQGFRPGG